MPAIDSKKRNRASENEVLAEQVGLLYSHFTFMSLANLPTVLIFTYILGTRLGWAYILPWAAGLATSILLRVRLARQFKQAAPAPSEIHFWAGQAVKSMFLSGLLWAILPPVSSQINLNTFLVVATLLCMMVTIFLASSSAYRPAFFAFAIPILGSTAFSFILLVREHWYAGVLILFGLAILINLNKYAHQMLLESIKIRFENRDLIDQLTEQKAAAEDANQSKSRFLAAASHDLRQPLHALNLYFDALAMDPSQARRQSLIGKITAAIRTLNNLFDRLLDISRLEAGVITPSIGVCALEEVFDYLNIQFRPLAEEKGLELKLEHNRLHVYSDSMLLQQILDNLVSNAVRYTDEGGIDVTASKDDGAVLVRVADTGRGIPAHEQHNIFNEFYQLDDSGQDHERGLGLGLSIVKRLCELTNHKLSVRSTLDKGTEFQLRLMRVPGSGIDSAARENSYDSDLHADRYGDDHRFEHARQGSRESTGAAFDDEYSPALQPSDALLHEVCLLIIDDDADIRDAMRERLSGWGCRIESVDSIQGAVGAVSRGFSPDVVLADFRLRGRQTGIQAIGAVQQVLGRTVAGILITGDTAAEPLQEAARSGYPLLHKPIRSEQLYEIIYRAIRNLDADR